MSACRKCGAVGDQPCWSYWPLADGSYIARPAWLPHASRRGPRP